MKNDKLRINIDYVINIAIAALYAVGGLLCIAVCAYFAAKLEGADILNWDNEYSTVFSLLLLPFVIGIYIIVFGAMIIVGFIPASIGLVIGSLCSIARFAYTEHGTVATKPYKILMTTSYIVSAVATALYISGFLSLIGMGLISQ
ncbi:MAG: hypothetical protein J6U16_08455 [Ruminococcus sp.]|nr:hypothetical protein [Ruminococcus sp.]